MNTDSDVLDRVTKTLPEGAHPSDMLWENLPGPAGEAREIYLQLPEEDQAAVRRALAQSADLCGR